MDKNNYVIFKKQYGNIKRPKVKELSINQNGIKIFEKDQSMIINIILPVEESSKVYKFFEEFNFGEDILINISDSGDLECIFKGISSMIDKDSYSSFSITIQEKYQRPDQLQVEADCSQVDENGNPINECIGCGIHRE